MADLPIPYPGPPRRTPIPLPDPEDLVELYRRWREYQRAKQRAAEQNADDWERAARTMPPGMRKELEQQLAADTTWEGHFYGWADDPLADECELDRLCGGGGKRWRR